MDAEDWVCYAYTTTTRRRSSNHAQHCSSSSCARAAIHCPVLAYARPCARYGLGRCLGTGTCRITASDALVPATREAKLHRVYAIAGNLVRMGSGPYEPRFACYRLGCAVVLAVLTATSVWKVNELITHSDPVYHNGRTQVALLEMSCASILPIGSIRGTDCQPHCYHRAYQLLNSLSDVMGICEHGSKR